MEQNDQHYVDQYSNSMLNVSGSDSELAREQIENNSHFDV